MTDEHPPTPAAAGVRDKAPPGRLTPTEAYWLAAVRLADFAPDGALVVRPGAMRAAAVTYRPAGGGYERTG